MNRNEHLAAMAGALLFAIGAVAIIIYQHVQATASVLSAVSGGAVQGPGQADLFGDLADGLGVSASLAGSPIVGQDGTSNAPTVIPLSINPGYTLQ